jgi:hypothetical protein
MALNCVRLEYSRRKSHPSVPGSVPANAQVPYTESDCAERIFWVVPAVATRSISRSKSSAQSYVIDCCRHIVFTDSA